LRVLYNLKLMNVKYSCLAILFILSRLICSAQGKRGANIPWTTYEAENMQTTGTVSGPQYGPFHVETESSGQKCVKLSNDQYVEFTASEHANSVVIRYSLPDAKEGNGLNSALLVYKNGNLLQRCEVTSAYSWLYGKYPFTNDPTAGEPRHFYDEARLVGFEINKGDVIRVKRDDQKDNAASYCIIDLVDLEDIAPALPQPSNSIAITDKEFADVVLNNDYTEALRNCITKAAQTGKTVWIPAGTFKITGDITLPENISVQGAGMWYTQLVGNEALYSDANRRVRLKGSGNNIHIADFAIIGKLKYRSDKEANDGIVGSYGTNSTISNIWIEHTKVGMWIENSKNLHITGCRMRNTNADGINFCVGMTESTIENCTARGTGDDCFAIWPAVFLKQAFSPGHNLVINCTGQLPFLANGAAVYGGESNAVKNCSFTDISQGSAILISTTFPTENKDKNINNNFSGTTVIENCDITTSGGFDHEWDWRGAVEICTDKRDIAGLEIKNLNIIGSLSNSLSVIGKNDGDKTGILLNTVLENISVSNSGLATKGYGLFINSAASGGIAIKQSDLQEIKNNSENFTIEK
jgi:hypothetical protein